MADNQEPFVAEAMLLPEEGQQVFSVPDANPPGVETMPMPAGDALLAAPLEAAPSPVPEAPAAAGAPLSADAKPVLVVQRGLKVGIEYPIYEGQNFIGRADEKPVDVDLDDQEPPDRVWSSRQHAVIFFENGELSLEDLNSANGTFVNRTRVYPGQKRALQPNDVVQVGTVQMKLKV